MTYQQTLDYLYSRLPMFHRIGVAAYKADLNNTIALADMLNHPEKKFRSVHVAGTNGKGSVSNMLSSIMQEAGYKTGLFTSPHLKDFRERIRINGKMIDEEYIIRFVEKHKQSFEDIQPSFFEWTAALAFKFFADEKVDVAIIETGLGGRLDSTNIITPDLSVITNISFDHMQLLGDTLEKIAMEKAGIIKKSIPIVVGERQKICERVFIDKAAEMNARLEFASDNFKAEFLSTEDAGQKFRILNGNNEIVNDELLLALKGNYQVKNICTVLKSVELLKKQYDKINDDSVVNGLKNVVKNTGLMGRWQVIGNSPLTIADVAHNEAGIGYVMKQLVTMVSKSNRYNDHGPTPNAKRQTCLHIVFGMVNDKSPSSVLTLLPKDAVYYFCKADIPRALDAEELKNAASVFDLNGNCYSSVAAALNAARLNASENDLVFVGGSTFVVAEVV